MIQPWIGVDFDATLRNSEDGSPILATVQRIERWREDGFAVRIVTARLQPRELAGRDLCGICAVDVPGAVTCNHSDQFVHQQIRLWCILHLGFYLPIQWGKSRGMIEFWDDKAVSVEPNTGHRTSPSKYDPLEG